MKKMISLLLVMVLVLGLCACGTSQEESAAGLQVGYGREKIMPDAPVPLDGYGQNQLRVTDQVLDFLYATCNLLVCYGLKNDDFFYFWTSKNPCKTRVSKH